MASRNEDGAMAGWPPSQLVAWIRKVQAILAPEPDILAAYFERSLEAKELAAVRSALFSLLPMPRAACCDGSRGRSSSTRSETHFLGMGLAMAGGNRGRASHSFCAHLSVGRPRGGVATKSCRSASSLFLALSEPNQGDDSESRGALRRVPLLLPPFNSDGLANSAGVQTLAAKSCCGRGA